MNFTEEIMPINVYASKKHILGMSSVMDIVTANGIAAKCKEGELPVSVCMASSYSS